MSWVAGFGCVLFDLDGTLYSGDVAKPGAPEAVSRVRGLGVRPVFMTNNSSRTPDGVAEHLRRLGFEAAPDEVVTSATVTAGWLSQRQVASAYVVGGQGLREALTAAGVEVCGDGAEPSLTPEVVVIGWDQEVTYDRLRTASIHVQKGARLVASNPDRAFPAPDGSRWPGAGALLAAVVATTDAEPEVIGKPHPPMYLAAREAGGGGRPLVVGDRLDTDIAGAAGLGWDTYLVLWGITSALELEASDLRPTRSGPDLDGLFAPG
jgi:HAD superfamily hydrolase (TIGR01450 family)